MIHEIDPKRYNNAFKSKKPTEADCLLCYDNNRLLLQKNENGYTFPNCSMLPAECWQDADYLFSVDDMDFYLMPDTIDPQTGPFEFYPVQQMREFDPRWMGFAAITGWQLSRWKANHKFCSRCGEQMAPSVKERAFLCPSCGFIVYPRISPAVIVAVTDGDRILMINAKNAPPERYHLIAGFVEIGESLEQAVAREVKEEAGINVKNIRYYKNQPWSVTDTLMVGFTAELDGDDTLTPQESEISDAKWFSRSDLPVNASTASIGSELSNRFKAGLL